MMIVTETMVMKLEILPQSPVVVVVNNHKADDNNNETDGNDKDNNDANQSILALLPVENRLSCWWLVIWGGGRIINATCTEFGPAFQWQVTSDGGKTGQDGPF
eukprot:2362144-Ditylum_brightwellii.AAC.1